MVEYKPAEFSSVASFFDNFDEDHIVNFHFADITDHSPGLVPGPTVIRIEGFFEIVKDQWDFYVGGDEHRWFEVADSRAPHIPGLSDEDRFIWLESSSWIDTHRGRGIAGRFTICNESRFVWFSLMRG